MARTNNDVTGIDQARYVLQCSMPISMDAKAGSGFATHADAGMLTEFEIKN